MEGKVMNEPTMGTTHLQYLCYLVVPSTVSDGVEVKANKVFGAHASTNLRELGEGATDFTAEKVVVDVLAMEQDGHFQEVFGSLTKDPCLLCLSPGQIEVFCHDNLDILRRQGGSTFFLFDKEGILSVAVVTCYKSSLLIRRRRFSFGHIWRAICRHRLVVKQQPQPD